MKTKIITNGKLDATGITYQLLDQNTLKTLSPPGANLRIKVEINSADTQIYSLVLLYT